MENFKELNTDLNVIEVEKIENQPRNERFELTNKVLSKLILWGLIAISPLAATGLEASTSDDNKRDERAMTSAFENRFKEAGLLSEESDHNKPVVVITTRENIEKNYLNKDGPMKTVNSYNSEMMKVDMVNDGNFTIVERDSHVLDEILKEVKLGETRLINPDQRVKLGNWTPANYYVLSSTTNEGEKFILMNEIVDLKDGSVSSVFVESGEENSNDSIIELAKVTEKIIENIESNKNHGQEK